MSKVKMVASSCLLGICFTYAGAFAGPFYEADRAEIPDRSATADRGAPSGLFDDFELYIPGQSLAGQSDWFNVVDSGDTVLSSGIQGQSGAHMSDGSESSGQVLAKTTETGEYGVLSLDIEIVTSDSGFTVFPGSEANLLNTGIRFSSDGRILVFQDSNPGDGFLELVSTNSFWQQNTPMRVDFEVLPDGEVRIRLDGRVILIGEDTGKINNDGVSTPVNFFGVRADNAHAGDTIVIDNVSDLATVAQDSPGEVDLYHAVSRGMLVLGNTLVDVDSAYVGQTFTVSTLTVNTNSQEAALGARVDLSIPPELDFVSADCAGAVKSDLFVSEPFDIPPEEFRICSIDLRLNESLDAVPGNFLLLETQVTATAVTDPYLPNNSAVFFVLEDPGILFADGFESD